MNTVQLVATVPAIKAHLPAQFAARYASQLSVDPNFCPRGPVSANFPIDPAQCQTKFGRWLAERISTTRFDDDFSRIRITHRCSQEDLHVREMAERMKATHLTSVAELEQLHTRIKQWLNERHGFARAYGERICAPVSGDFQWPVFGSMKVADALTPEAYFDACAKLIRSMKPAKVEISFSRECPPEQLGVCRA